MIGHGYSVVEAARPDGTAPTLLTKPSPGTSRGVARSIASRRRRRLGYSSLAAAAAFVLKALPSR